MSGMLIPCHTWTSVQPLRWASYDMSVILTPPIVNAFCKHVIMYHALRDCERRLQLTCTQHERALGHLRGAVTMP
jgi:hypothetical protein